MELVSFGEAVKALKDGRRVTRKGWNGKDMFLYYVPPASYKSMTDVAKSIGDSVQYREYLALKTAQGDVATWSPSGSDALADDWIILDPYDYKDRLMVEMNQLCERINKLKTALKNKAVPLGAMIVLKKQLDVMNEYNDILQSRL